MNKLRATLAAVALCLWSPVSAAIIDESVVGDIPNSFHSVIGTLGLG